MPKKYSKIYIQNLKSTGLSTPKKEIKKNFRWGGLGVKAGFIGCIARPEILKIFGYTKGCLGCEAKLFGIEHRNHTPACRARMEQKMIADEMLKEILYTRDQRLTSCNMSVTQQHQEAE